MMASGCTTAPSPEPQARTFQLIYPGEPDAPLHVAPLPMALIDRSGLVQALRVAGPGPGGQGWRDGVAAVPDNPTRLVLTWVGGACDDRVSMILDGTQSSMQVAINTTATGGCRAVGIGRSVELDLSVAVRPEDVRLTAR